VSNILPAECGMHLVIQTAFTIAGMHRFVSRSKHCHYRTVGFDLLLRSSAQLTTRLS
jgi:hypothetical protein